MPDNIPGRPNSRNVGRVANSDSVNIFPKQNYKIDLD